MGCNYFHQNKFYHDRNLNYSEIFDVFSSKIQLEDDFVYEQSNGGGGACRYYAFFSI